MYHSLLTLNGIYQIPCKCIIIPCVKCILYLQWGRQGFLIIWLAQSLVGMCICGSGKQIQSTNSSFECNKLILLSYEIPNFFFHLNWSQRNSRFKSLVIYINKKANEKNNCVVILVSLFYITFLNWFFCQNGFQLFYILQ